MGIQGSVKKKSDGKGENRTFYDSSLHLPRSTYSAFVLLGSSSVQGSECKKHVLFGLQGSTESCNTTTEDEDLKGRCWPLVGRGPQQCPRYLGSNGAPVLSVPRTDMGTLL